MRRRTRRCEREGAQMRLSAMALAGLLALSSGCDDGPAPRASEPGGSAPGLSSAGGSASSASAPVESSGTATAGDASGLASRVAARLDALPARTSLYARHLPSGREIAVRADEPNERAERHQDPGHGARLSGRGGGDARPGRTLPDPPGGSAAGQRSAPDLRTRTGADLSRPGDPDDHHQRQYGDRHHDRARRPGPGQPTAVRARLRADPPARHHRRSLPARLGDGGSRERRALPSRSLRAGFPLRRGGVRAHLPLRGRPRGMAREHHRPARSPACSSASTTGRSRHASPATR